MCDEQRAATKQCATDHLGTKLVKAGHDEEEVYAMERPALMEAMALVIAKGVASGGKLAVDPDRVMKERELALREEEIRLRKIEEKRRIDERVADEKRWQDELKLRIEERDAEEKRRIEDKEAMDKRWHEEIKLREKELDRQYKLDAAKAKEDTSLVGRTRKFAEAIKHVFPEMPTESAELLVIFDSVENLFMLYELPADLCNKLLLPRLSGKAKTIVNKFTLKDLGKTPPKHGLKLG